VKRLSIVVPFYDEQAAIRPLFARLEALSRTLDSVSLEIVCVNDGSNDGTLAALQEEQGRFSRGDVVIVDLSRNFGKEAALSAGLATCGGDAVVPMDADLQDPPELVPAMVESWMKGAEVVLARRSDRSSDSWLKRTGARLFYKVQNSVSDVALPADVGDFRLMDRMVVDVIKALPENRRFMKGLFAWAGFKTTVLEYRREPRSAGSSSFTTVRLLHLALEGISSFSLLPLRVASYIGAVAASLSLAYGGWIVFRTLYFGVDVPGYASIFTAIVLLGGIQLVCLGIIGEYVGRTYLEAKRRPAFVIRKVFRPTS
jgi:glycosyltransferase involved in cell wall biosynthesis